MDLSESDKSVLVLWLVDAIGRSRIDSWAVYCKDLDIPRLSEKASAKFAKMFERGSITDFYKDQLFRHVLKGCPSSIPQDDVPVKTIDGYADTYNIAKDIAEEFIRLPKRYRVLVRASSAMSTATKGRHIDLRISDRLKMIRSSLLKEEVIFHSGNEKIDKYTFRYNQIDDHKLADDHLYFVYDAAGCMGNLHGKIVSDFLHEVRAFYGACVAHDLLHPYPYHRDPITPIIIGVEHDSKIITYVESLDTDLVDCTYFLPSDGLQSRYLKPDKFYKSLHNIVDFFSASSEKLKTAAIWLLRAKGSVRPMDQVLESAIALEVLLGDQAMSDKVGLTKLMANRCAFALGKSIKDRDDYIEFFMKFYRLRSEIVHTGKLNPNKDEEEIVERGINLASDMLIHEQRLSDT